MVCGRGGCAQACVALKSDLARVARECPDLVFLNIDATSGNGAAMAKELGVTRFPTQQYYKNGQMVWQVRALRAPPLRAPLPASRALLLPGLGPSCRRRRLCEEGARLPGEGCVWWLRERG